jgi:hypothetical protein
MSYKNNHEVTEDDSVQKEELIHLHMLLIQVRKCCESIANDQMPSERYNSLDVSPLHIHKEKKAHKDALLTLGGEIVTHIHRQPIRVMNYASDNAMTEVTAQH